MKIEKVEGLLIGSDLIGTNFVVRITTDSGLTGYRPVRRVGLPGRSAAVVDQFRAYLIGQDPLRIDHIQQSLYRMRPFRGNILSGALSAIDIALWDIKGKHYGAPVWDLLGGKFRDKVRLHLLLPLREHGRRAGRSRARARRPRRASRRSSSTRCARGYADMTLSRLIEGGPRDGRGRARRRRDWTSTSSSSSTAS